MSRSDIDEVDEVTTRFDHKLKNILDLYRKDARISGNHTGGGGGFDESYFNDPANPD